ncbi:hypothetical protein Y032_0104g3599 [Ancylostoma ceylanicum]|uniref:Uncharacterized protein n=1 Tax=Ancylostoma ceylanicum TaxID=53326 RepID=A0A016TGG7_9BILA|nr:hypothetical protein Y032_0104g3599 [Ancylostoma ceylanicum]
MMSCRNEQMEAVETWSQQQRSAGRVEDDGSVRIHGKNTDGQGRSNGRSYQTRRESPETEKKRANVVHTEKTNPAVKMDHQNNKQTLTCH